jgi:hypothetical protein
MVKKKGQEEFEDTKGVNRISNLKKDIQRNGQKKQGNNDLQSITHKTKDPVTSNIGCESRYSGRASSIAFCHDNT